MLPGDWGQGGPNLMGTPKFYDTGFVVTAWMQEDLDQLDNTILFLTWHEVQGTELHMRTRSYKIITIYDIIHYTRL